MMQKDTVKNAINEFLEEHKADLENWTKMYVNGELSKEEFETLMRGLKSAAYITGLTEALKAQGKIDTIYIIYFMKPANNIFSGVLYNRKIFIICLSLSLIVYLCNTFIIEPEEQAYILQVEAMVSEYLEFHE